jgi:putative transposase
VVALGIGIDGTKHPLALVEGSTENATLVTDLLVGLRERGLDVTRPILAVLDGAKALSRAVRDVFDRPLIQRCHEHKIRNVRDRLPDKLRSPVARRMREAYHADSALAAEAKLTTLATELDKTHPGAAASLARWADGASLVRRRHGQGRRTVPPRQRPPAPAQAPRRAGTPLPRNCHTRRPESDQDRGLTITGPPPKFHGTRDMLGSPGRRDEGKIMGIATSTLPSSD